MEGLPNDRNIQNTRKLVIEDEALEWLADICDGDARIALNTLELSIKSRKETGSKVVKIGIKDVRSSLENAESGPERKSDRNQQLVTAMHICIRDGHANGALYWLARLMAAGEDPVFIGKRLIRIAGEDVGFGDPDALGRLL